MQCINFYKYQGAGNDFVLLDNRNGIYSRLTSKQIISLCDRHFGVGADGVILINSSQDFDFEVDYSNPDGTKSFCGNGARCAVAFFAWLTNQERVFTFNAFDGLHEAEYLPENQIKLKMADVNRIVETSSSDYELNTGSPHLVKFIKNIHSIDVNVEGALIRYSEEYKEVGVNVNFVEVLNEQSLSIRTYERGVENETLACGTGVTAAVLAYSENVNLSGWHKIDVQAKGGKLSVEFEKKEHAFNNIFLIGPANFVFKGEIYV